MIRAFIAVELPEALRHEVAALQATLRATGAPTSALPGLGDLAAHPARGRGSRAAGADVAWVKPANLHLTLKFLGNIDEKQRIAMSDQLLATAKTRKPFTIHLEGIGAFPSTRSPRVIWVGVTKGQEALTALAQAVEQACAGLGFLKEERPFSAHLTIGRVRSRPVRHPAARGAMSHGARDRLAGLIKQLQVVEFRGATPAPVDHVTLFQSTLSPQGPTYTALATLPLG